MYPLGLGTACDVIIPRPIARDVTVQTSEIASRESIIELERRTKKRRMKMFCAHVDYRLCTMRFREVLIRTCVRRKQLREHRQMLCPSTRNVHNFMHSPHLNTF
jgi:hypothetical protein